MLSQGEPAEPRDAAISFDTTASCMRLLWHSMGFLNRPTSAAVQMLKLYHTVRWFSQPWRKITPIAGDHGTRPTSRGKPTVIVNTWLSYSAKKCYNAYTSTNFGFAVRTTRSIYSSVMQCLFIMTTPKLLFSKFLWAFVPIEPINVHAKFEIRSFTHSWDNRGYPKKLSSPWIRLPSLFSKIFNGLLFGRTLW